MSFIIGYNTAITNINETVHISIQNNSGNKEFYQKHNYPGSQFCGSFSFYAMLRLTGNTMHVVGTYV